MKRSEQDQLLEAIFSDAELLDFRKASLEAGLGQLRAQRLRRRVLRVGLACLPVGLAMALFFGNRTPAEPQEGVKEKSLAMAAPGPGSHTQVQFITDEELFALFPNRHMALIGKFGEQQLVFLDRPAKH